MPFADAKYATKETPPDGIKGRGRLNSKRPWGSAYEGEEAANLGNSKLFYRKLGNLCRVFNVGLRDFEHLLGNYPRYGVVTLFETKSRQGLPVRGD
jgi:hypothetical protein